MSLQEKFERDYNAMLGRITAPFEDHEKATKELLEQTMSIGPKPVVDMGTIHLPDFDEISVKLSHAEALLLAAFHQLESRTTTQIQANTAHYLIMDALEDIRELKEIVYPTTSIEEE